MRIRDLERAASEVIRIWWTNPHIRSGGASARAEEEMNRAVSRLEDLLKVRIAEERIRKTETERIRCPDCGRLAAEHDDDTECGLWSDFWEDMRERN